MYVVHHFLLVFLVETQWTTFTNGLIINVTKLSFKPTSIAVDNITGNVYAAGSFYLARLNSNLKQLNQIKICKTCKSRVLEIDYRTRKLLVCGVSDKGSCTYHNLNNISNFTMLTSRNNKGDTVGSNGSVVALFLPPSQRKHSELVMGISQPLENQIDLLSFRKIASGHLTYLQAGSNGKLRISDEFRKDVKVHFVYGFQFKDGLYFLVNKRGTNGTSSWLFRIWYNETSVYPFTAIPISCTEKTSEGNSKTTEKKYNLAIAGKLYEHPSHESLVVSFGYNRDKGTHIPDEKFGSSVCMFRMEEITKDMNFLSSKCGLETFVTASEWIIGHGTVGYNDMTNSSCKQGYNNALEAIEEGRDFNPVKVVKNQLITSVIPFPVDGQLHIIISTNPGQLYYYYKTKDEKYWFEIPNEKNGFLADVEINTKTKTAYTITENKVVKISLDYCQKNLNCSTCVQDSKFMCVWFKGQCFATDRNTGGLENTCPPEITSIDPNHGVKSGNNRIKIHGNYLGNSVRAYRSVKLCSVPCIVNNALSTSSTIVCKTESASKEEKCAVTVDINDTESSPHMKGSVNSGNNSKLYFYFKTASITSFNPELGPESGGTNITVIGKNLDLTKRVDIKIKDLSLQCQIRSINDTVLLCTTKPLKQNQQNRNTNESIGCGTLALMMENAVLAETTGTFCYWKDPQITNVHPRRSIKSGGLDVNVEGTNLNVIANPRLGITLDNSEIQPEAEDCKARTSTTMICKTPGLTSVVPNDTSVSGDIYFIMDGVKELQDFAKTHPNLSQIKVNPDPEFSSVPKDGLVDSLENDLSIKGTNIKESEVETKEIQVTITSSAGTNITCPVIKLGEEAVSCRPNLTSAVNETQFVVQVKVGNRYYKVGNIFVNPKGKISQEVPDIPKKITQYAIVVGVATSVVVCIILIACLIWCVCRQKKDDKMRHMFIEMSESAADSHLIISGVQQVKRLMDASTIMNIEKANLFINREKLIIGEVIGAGNFGCVCEGTLLEEDDIELKVAVKTLQDTDAGEINLKEFVEEALLMKDFEHPNVLKLIGITLSKDSSPLVILPFMGNGDLLKYVSDEEKEISLNQMIMFAIDISRGMEYLGSLKFVHRDLAARNCMLDDHFHVKVADFGLTRDIYEKGYYHSENKKTKLPIRWMAIESIERGTYSSKSDVWSLAVVIWELLTRGVTPYPGVEGWDVIAYLRSGRRLRKPWFSDDTLYSLMLACWNKDIEARPDFTEVTGQLNDILHEYETSSHGFTTDTFGKQVPNPPTLVTIPDCYNYYESLSPRTVETQQYFVLEKITSHL